MREAIVTATLVLLLAAAIAWMGSVALSPETMLQMADMAGGGR